MGRVGRPGLAGTVARTAVVAGTATAVSGGMQRKAAANAQQAADAAAYREGQAAAAAAPPDAAAPAADAGSGDRIAQLERLAQLHQQGVLSDEELAAEKARVLGS